MKRLLIIALLLLAAVSVNAQTTVTGSGVQDANGNLYATFQDQNGTQHNATVSAFLVAQSGAIPKANGVSMNPALGPFPIDATGSFSITVTPNSVILPSGSQWQFTICGTSVNLGPQPSPLLQVCFNTALITIVSPGPQDITTQANAAAKLLGPKLGGGGGGGSGTVGPGTPGTFAGFSTATTVNNADCTFDGIHPDRCPNGMNTAANGDHDEWGVDAGGTIAGRAACVTGNRLIQTCAIGATSGFVGIADSTVSAGGTTSICWAGRCNATTTNNATKGDYMIMSVSVAGEMDDVGVTKPTGAIQFFPVDSTVTAGQLVLTTLLDPNLLNAMAVGVGTINNCGPGVAYYPSLGTVINCIPNPTTPANVPQSLIATPGGTPAFALGGVPVNAQTGVSYTWLPTDRLSFITGSNAGATAWTGPALTNNFTAAFLNLNAGLITFTPSSGLVNGNATQIIPQNWFGFHYTNGANSWMPVTPTIAAFPQCLDTGGNHLNFSNVTGTFICGTSSTALQPGTGNSPTSTWKIVSGNYTVSDSENGYHIQNSGAGSQFTIGTPNTIATSPLIGRRVNTGSITTSPFVSGTFSQSANNNMLCTVTNTGGTQQAVSSITDTVSDSFSKLAEQLISSGSTSVSIWLATGITVSASNAITVTWAANPGQAQVVCEELQSSATKDTVSVVSGTSITGFCHSTNCLAIAMGFGGSVVGWINIGGGNGEETDYRLLNNQGSVTYIPNGSNTALGMITFNIASTPTFVTGWNVTLVNASGGAQTVVATATPINGQGSDTQVLLPNEECTFTSNASVPGYDSICGFTPNLVLNGVIGSVVDVCVNAKCIQNNISADFGATTVYTVGANDSAFTAIATLTCRGAVAGQPSLTVTFTDTSNTAQTLSLTGVDCTALGGNSRNSMNASFRAKAATNIQVTTTHANSQPTYDVDVSILQRHTL